MASEKDLWNAPCFVTFTYCLRPNCMQEVFSYSNSLDKFGHGLCSKIQILPFILQLHSNRVSDHFLSYE